MVGAEIIVHGERPQFLRDSPPRGYFVFQHAPAPNRRQHCKKRRKADQHRRLLAVSTDIRAVSATASIWSLAASMLVSRPW